MIRHHYKELFRDDPVWFDRAGDLSSRVFELTEFIAKVEKIENIGGHFNDTVTYHDSCQVLRGLGISSEPRKLLKNKQGLDFIEMERSQVCCGFGGVFSFKFPHISKAMVRDKVNSILASKAHIVTGCEISCLMHIRGYLDTHDIPVRAVHIADILARGI
jgi:L-lactate dehydrogenase complex protein LldE